MNHSWEGGLCINNKEEEKDKIVNMVLFPFATTSWGVRRVMSILVGKDIGATINGYVNIKQK
jgi:hypothetical protein